VSASDGPDITTVTSLDGLAGGRYIVTTRSGARHLVDLDARTVTRFAAAGSESSLVDVGFGPVTADGAETLFTRPSGATVGQRTHVTNNAEWRLTSTVVAIAPVDDPAGETPV
jgi:hypothetical protein